MTGTVRISRFESSPATTFYLSADEISYNVAGNYSIVRSYLSCYNGPGGSTGSFNGSAGYQAGSIDGIGEFGRRSGNPLLPSGFANGALRWEVGPFDVVVPHNAAGDKAITLRMIVAYGSHSFNLTAGLGLTFIPKPPAKPAAPTVVPSVDGKSATVSFAAPSNGGSAITGYVVQRALDAAFTTGVATVNVAGSPSVITALDPGAVYYWRVAAKNAYGTGPYSNGTLAVQPNRALGRIRNSTNDGWLNLQGRIRNAANDGWIEAEGRIRNADDTAWIPLGS